MSPADFGSFSGTDEEVRAIWGEWKGREAAFYVNCHRMVEILAWNEVLAIGGAEVAALSRLVVDKFKRLMSSNLPARLKVGPYQVVRADDDRIAIMSASARYKDFVYVHRRLLERIHVFDGRPLKDAIEIIEEYTGESIDPRIVREMTDHGILLDAT